MIIIDGPDLVGKTTLANELCKRLGYIYHHLGKLPEQWNSPIDYLALLAYNVVQDRFYASELVYSQIRGEPCKVTPYHVRLIDGRMAKIGAMHILIYDIDETIISKRFDQSREMYDLEKIKRANRLFSRIGITQGRFQMRINASLLERRGEDVIRSIINEYRKIQEEAANFRQLCRELDVSFDV